MSEIRAKLESSQSAALSLEKQASQLKVSVEEKNGKIEELLQQIYKVREEAADKEQSFVDETSTKSKLADLYKQASDEAAARISDLEMQLEEAQQSIEATNCKIEELKAEYDSSDAYLRNLLNEKEALIATLKEQTNVTAELSSNAAAAMQTVRSGQSLSQVFADLAQTRTSLLEATQENERLKVCLRDICEDIEAKLPGIQADRQENNQLKATVTGLSERLLNLTQEKDRYEQALKAVQCERDELKKKSLSLEKEVADLGLQVQTLLLQQEQPELAQSDLITSDQVITSRLVPIKNIAELQVRNQELLRVVRELGNRAEAAEAQARDLQVGAGLESQLQAAMKEIEELREARVRQTAMVESLMKQQQQQSSINNASVDLTNDNESQQSEIVETSNHHKNYEHEKYLMNKLEEARQEVMMVKSTLAKAQAKADFNQERLDLLRSNYESCRQELEMTRQGSSEQSKALSRIQGEMQTMLSDVITAKESARRAESELAVLKNGLATAQLTEKRLLGERESLLEEKQKLSQLLSGLQAMVSESEASSQTLRERLSGQVEFLERELQGYRKKLEDASESHRLDLAAMGRENRELQEKINKLYEESRTATTAAAVVETVQPRIEADQQSDLVHTRQQLEQFKLICTANEKSLLELGHEFDEYKQRSQGELEAAQSNLSKAKAELEDLSKKHAEEEAKWNSERTTIRARLEEFEQVESMMKEQSGMRAEDIARLQALLVETQGKLESEMQGHQQANVKLEEISIKLRASEENIHQLKVELEQGRLCAEQRETQLGERLKDVEHERDRAVQRATQLNQAIPMSPVMEESEAVQFLRKQKDLLQEELQSLQQDNRRLLIQLEQTQALLEESRLRLADEQSASQWQTNMTTEYEQLQAKITNMAGLKEANFELNGQVQMLSEKLTRTERQLSDYASQYEGAARSLREAQAIESTRSEQIRLIEQDRDTWKGRLEQLLESGDAAQQIKKLTEEKERACQKADALEIKVKQVIARSLQLQKELKDRPDESQLLVHPWI